MKKINQKDVVQAIIQEALTIKRKRELFKEAKKINEELKQLNEYGHPGVMAGYGFKAYEGPSPVLGLATQSNYEEVKPEDCEDCELDQFSSLEKDMEEFGDLDEGDGSEVEDVQSLKDENEQLKARLAQIESVFQKNN